MHTQTIEFEGVELVCEEIDYQYDDNNFYKYWFSNLKPGDIYIGKRNQGWKMGTVSEKHWNHTRELGYIYGEENIYPYNISECLKVLEIKE